MIKKIMALLLSLSLLLPGFALGETSVPSKLDAPTDLKAELKYYDDGRPYFYFEFKIPQSILDLNTERPGNGYMDLELDRKVDSEEWFSAADNSAYDGGSIEALGVVDETGRIYSFISEAEDEGDLTSVNIKNRTYSYRVRFNYSYFVGGTLHNSDLLSAFSNTVTIGSGTYSKTERLSGASRIETAIAVSQEGWSSGADTVILTREDNYPDALTGTPLSKKYDAPILFTNRLTLTPATAAEITRLNPKKIVILGGGGAVSDAIESGLKQNYTVQRIGGTDRYDTAAKIAIELGYKGKVVITTGQDFHDALVVAPLAAFKGIPILLTQPASLPAATKDALQFIAPSESTVVGNVNAVSNGVFAQLLNAKRISGSDIYETAVLVAKHFGANTDKVFLATGKDFPDALSGSAVAAKFNSPILFVGDPLSGYVKQYLADNKSTVSKINLLGGTGAISEIIRKDVESILK